jgi:prolyl 4-hydroxylase
MTIELSADWRAWIQTNVANGQDKHRLFKILLDNGFDHNTIRDEMQFEPTTKTEFSAEWKTWIATNVENGSDKNGLFKVLLDAGFAYQAIQEEMLFEPSVPVIQLVNPLAPKNEAHLEYTAIGAALRKVSILNGKRLPSDSLQLFTLEHFLSNHECQHVITAIKSALRPSTLSSDEIDSTFRTSKTCDLGNLHDAVIQDIDQRICRLLGIDESYSEPIQGQYYEVGQEFKPHTDYFEAHEMASHGSTMGQRTFTVMVYLNTVEQGGVTSFPKVNSAYRPKEGLAVIWSNLDASGSPNINSLHHGQPVLGGYKAIITKWFRRNSRLPEPPPMFVGNSND